MQSYVQIGNAGMVFSTKKRQVHRTHRRQSERRTGRVHCADRPLRLRPNPQLLNLVAGLLDATEWRCLLLSETRMIKGRDRNVRLVFQIIRLLPWLTAFEERLPPGGKRFGGSETKAN